MLALAYQRAYKVLLKILSMIRSMSAETKMVVRMPKSLHYINNNIIIIFDGQSTTLDLLKLYVSSDKGSFIDNFEHNVDVCIIIINIIIIILSLLFFSFVIYC